MSDRSKNFDKALREIIVPRLIGLDFVFDGSRTFRRYINDNSTVQIINFQLGQRSYEGKFTINLGVFIDGDFEGVTVKNAKESSCTFERRIRIGQIIPSKFPLISKLPLLNLFIGPGDKWWKLSKNYGELNEKLSTLVIYIEQYGLIWLYEKSPNQ